MRVFRGMSEIRVARLGMGPISLRENFEARFSSFSVERCVHMFWDLGDL